MPAPATHATHLPARRLVGFLRDAHSSRSSAVEAHVQGERRGADFGAAQLADHSAVRHTQARWHNRVLRETPTRPRTTHTQTPGQHAREQEAAAHRATHRGADVRVAVAAAKRRVLARAELGAVHSPCRRRPPSHQHTHQRSSGQSAVRHPRHDRRGASQQTRQHDLGCRVHTPTACGHSTITRHSCASVGAFGVSALPSEASHSETPVRECALASGWCLMMMLV